MRTRSFVAGGAVLALTALSAPALAPADTGTNGNLRLQLETGVNPARPSTAAAPRGVSLSYRQTLTTVSGERPTLDVKRITITLPEGFEVNLGAFPNCVLSDIPEDPNLPPCPESARIGSGSATADARPTFSELIPATVRAYAGVSDLDVQNRPQDPVPALIVTASATVGETTINGFFVAELRGRRFVLDFPSGGGGGPESLFIIRDLRLTLRNLRGEGGAPLVQAPTTCSGRWRFTQTTTFFGGTSVSARDNVPCVRAVRPVFTG